MTNRDVALAASAAEDFDLDSDLWTTEAKDGEEADLDPALGAGWKRAGSQFQAESPGVVSDLRLVSPPVTVGDGDFTLTVRHRYMFEMDSYYNQYDGGVIELQVDGTDDWMDIGGSVYDGWVCDGSNPLADRNAFTYINWDYPGFNTVSIDLGTEYAGQTVRVRFRAGADEATGWGGWTIDRVARRHRQHAVRHARRRRACAGHSSGGGGGGGGCATGGALGWAALLAGAALALRFRRRRAR